jgi:hypothetical protein
MTGQGLAIFGPKKAYLQSQNFGLKSLFSEQPLAGASQGLFTCM